MHMLITGIGAGTLTTVAKVAGKVGKDGKVKDINKAMLADSVGSVAGAMIQEDGPSNQTR